jgi:ABC-2 type transport system ATP-binding protein
MNVDDFPLVRFEKASKRYGGTIALDELTLTIPSGTVTAILGRNGAGKSTALRCLVGLARPDTGTVRVFEADPWTMEPALKQRIGYMAEQGVPFTTARPAQLASMCAPLYPRWDHTLARRILDRFGINEQQRLDKMSLGQQRAVALLLAICPRPDLLILDEPAANLDAAIRRDFLEEVLALLHEAGSTVILSSHILSDVERVADRVAIVHQGRLLLARELDELRENVRRVRLIYPGEAPTPPSVPGLLRARRAGRELLLTLDACDEERLRQLVATTGAQVEAQHVGLEDLFIDLTTEPSALSAA